MLFAILKNIAEKLGLTQHEIICVYAFNRVGCSKQGAIRTLIALNKVVERFGLTDSAFEKTYGEQLAEKGILTEAEGAFFSGMQEINEAKWLERKNQIIAAAGGVRSRDSKSSQGKPSVRVQRKARAKRSRRSNSKSGNPKRGSAVDSTQSTGKLAQADAPRYTHDANSLYRLQTPDVDQ